MSDILAVIYSYDRYELLAQSLKSMFENPGMDFRLWVVENGSYHSKVYGEMEGLHQLKLLIDYYRMGRIETLILNQINMGVHYSINQLMALAKITAAEPYRNIPDFIFATNDDMIYEPNWLLETYNTLLETEDYPKGKVIISSPFHCIHSGREIPTIDTYKGYKIKNSICGNTWFMRSDTWLNTFGYYPMNIMNDGGDCSKLDVMNSLGYHGVMTKTEFAHHHSEAIGRGKYARSGNW